MLFSRTTVKKPSRLTLIGTRISLLRLQNHSFSLFSYVSDVFTPKRHPNSSIWSPMIPFWIPKWSQTSSATSTGRPSGLAEPGRPGLASPAARSRLPAVGCSAKGGRGKREGQRRGAARRRSPPPHSYHRRWVILYVMPGIHYAR